MAESALRLLAEQLAINHLRNSVSADHFDKACRQRLTRPRRYGRRRIILVLGAGASYSCCGLPLGAKAARLLEKALVGPRGVSQRLFDAEVDRLSTEYQLTTEDFETTLLALSKFDQAGLLEQMRLLFNRRFHPSLTYELVAHLAKHRMIDGVINFNFDETLDQSLDDEIGRANYRYIASDGDLARENIGTFSHRISPDADFSKFLYLKPHGTAGHPSSMRFTKSSYTNIAPGLLDLLDGLFTGNTTMVVIGHGMKSVEFNRILRRSRANVEAFCFDTCKPEMEDLRRVHFVKVSNRHTLDSRARTLWKYVEAAFCNPPRDIARHELVARLFRSNVSLPKRRSADDMSQYFLDRTYVELALAIAKSKGFVNLQELSTGRTGAYFRLYSDARGARRIQSLLTLCRHLGLHQMHSANEAMRLGSEIQPDFDEGRCQLILTRNKFESMARQLAVRMTSKLSPRRQRRCRRIARALTQMYEGSEIEVQPTNRSHANEVFRSPHFLDTFTSIEAESDNFFARSDWDSVLCIAETGEWLAKVRERLRRRAHMRVSLIVADTTYRDALLSTLSMDRSCLQLLPWWLHNRHFTLYLHAGKPVRGIYFERRLRTSTVVPMSVRGSDADRLFSWFVIYSIKASRWRNDQRENVIGGTEIKAARRRVAQWLRRPRSDLRMPFPDLSVP